MIQVNQNLPKEIEFSMGEDFTPHAVKCFGERLEDVKMQLCFEEDIPNHKPEKDGPIQLEFSNGSLIHVTCCHGGIYIYETPMNESKYESLNWKNCSLQEDFLVSKVINSKLTKLKLITRERKFKETLFKRTCGVVFEFINKEQIIYIHHDEGEPQLYSEILSEYEVHDYIWEETRTSD